jgi:hypothetical protein
MGLQEWLTEFRVLHDKARSGTLSDYDAKLYKDGREELAAALVQAQRLTRKPEESAREALRVARAVQVDLELNSGKQRVVTLDICIGGFSTMMGLPPEPNEAVGVTMRMPEGKDHPIVARAKIVATKRQAAANHRVSFAFEWLSQSDTERLSILVFDGALAAGRQVKPVRDWAVVLAADQCSPGPTLPSFASSSSRPKLATNASR